MLWMVPLWLCLFLILLGNGLWLAALLGKLAGPSLRAPFDAFQLFWFGYAFAILFLEAYSLLLPIQAAALVSLTLVALAGFWIARRAIWRRLRGWRPRRPRGLLLGLLALVVSLVTAAHAARPIGWYDTHLYHLQVVQWARAFPAVPGVANLHYRLAYNNSVHLFAALVDCLWRDRAGFLALGLLASVTTLQLITRALSRNLPRAGYALLILPFVLARIGSRPDVVVELEPGATSVAAQDAWMAADRHEVASLSSDLPLSLLCIVVLLELLDLHRAPTRRKQTSIALALTLATVATTTKLGGLGVLFVSAAIAVWQLRARGWPRALLASWVALPALLLACHFARQALLSGWLFFPIPIGRLPLEWSLPKAETVEQFRWIESWARIPGEEPSAVLDHGTWHWLGPWLDRFARSREVVLLGLSLLVVLLRLVQPAARRVHVEGAALAAVLLSLLLWFRGAPDLRFGAGFFWMLLAVLGAPLLGRMLAQPGSRWMAWTVCCALSAWSGGFHLELPASGYVTHLPAPGHPSVRRLELSPGLEVSTPVDTDRCGNAPIPCTPYPAHQRARRPGDLGTGFLY